MWVIAKLSVSLDRGFVSEMKLFVRLTLCVFSQLYELIAYKLWFVDEHITILCIFILS